MRLNRRKFLQGGEMATEILLWQHFNLLSSQPRIIYLTREPSLLKICFIWGHHKTLIGDSEQQFREAEEDER